MTSNKMKQIDIDIDVYRAIESARLSFDEEANTILHRLLGIDQEALHKTSDGWTQSGAFLPNGTDLLMFYNGASYSAIVRDGKLLADGQAFKSLSGAAKHLTNTSINGWDYWQAFLPGENEAVPVAALRKQRPTRRGRS